MTSCSYPISDLLPHAPPMVLLDEILSWDEGRISAMLNIRPGIPFYKQDKGVPSYVGLEYMAQTCGAYAGIEGLNFGRPVRLGFLLGTRNYHAAADWFQPESKLVIVASEVLRQEFMGVFDCRICCEGAEIASAQLNLYQPDDTEKFLANKVIE